MQDKVLSEWIKKKRECRTGNGVDHHVAGPGVSAKGAWAYRGVTSRFDLTEADIGFAE